MKRADIRTNTVYFLTQSWVPGNEKERGRHSLVVLERIDPDSARKVFVRCIETGKTVLAYVDRIDQLLGHQLNKENQAKALIAMRNIRAEAAQANLDKLSDTEITNLTDNTLFDQI